MQQAELTPKPPIYKPPAVSKSVKQLQKLQSLNQEIWYKLDQKLDNEKITELEDQLRNK